MGEPNKPESNNSKSDDEDEEILGSDDDEQEDPKDYCKGRACNAYTTTSKLGRWHCHLSVFF